MKKKAAPPPERAERFIVLLRHGVAEEATPEKRDEDRGLTADGHARMKQIARGLERALPKAEAIYSSPLLRAVQTSLWVSKAYRSRLDINTVDALVPDAGAKQFLALIADIEERRAIIVGHEPSLTDNLRALVHIKESDAIELKKGGCYGIRLNPDGTAILEWLLPPRILRKLGE
ncbi:MAG TPA: phosphoglycerate mutase family protein [Thermoanaerobaculia bacterium]